MHTEGRIETVRARSGRGPEHGTPGLKTPDMGEIVNLLRDVRGPLRAFNPKHYLALLVHWPDHETVGVIARHHAGVQCVWYSTNIYCPDLQGRSNMPQFSSDDSPSLHLSLTSALLHNANMRRRLPEG